MEPLVHLKYAEPSQTPAQSFVVEIEQVVPYLGSVIDTVQLSPSAIVETLAFVPAVETALAPAVFKLPPSTTSEAEAERLFQPLLQVQPM